MTCQFYPFVNRASYYKLCFFTSSAWKTKDAELAKALIVAQRIFVYAEYCCDEEGETGR